VSADGDSTTSGRVTPATLLIVNTTDRRRGAEVRSVWIADGLRGRGWDVDLASLTTDPNGPRVPTETLTSRSPDSLGVLDRPVLTALRRRLTERAYDLVLANGSSTLRYVAASSIGAAPRRRLGYVAIGEPRYWTRTRAHRLRQRMWLSRFGWAIAVSEETGRQLRELVGTRLPIDVAYAGVPDDFFEIPRRPVAEPLRIVVLGSLTAEKDPLAALDVFRQAEPDPSWRIRFVGAGPLDDALAQRSREWSLANAVELRGSRDDVVQELSWANVVLSTSKTEGLPRSVVEAAAAGIPVLAYDVGGTREVVRDGETGALFQRGDVEGMAATLRRLHDEPDLRHQWGDAARRHARSVFTIDRTIDAYDRILRSRLPA